MRIQYENLISSRVFTKPLEKISDNYLILDNLIKSMENNIKMKQKELHMQFIQKVSRLDTLSPLKTLTRGYCLTEKDVTLKFFDGDIDAKIL